MCVKLHPSFILTRTKKGVQKVLMYHVSASYATDSKSAELLELWQGQMSVSVTFHLCLYSRTRVTRHTSECGTTCTPSSPVCLWRAQKKASPVSWTPNMPFFWRAPWMSTTAVSTAISHRSGAYWTPRATALACLWVSERETLKGNIQWAQVYLIKLFVNFLCLERCF